MDAARRRACFFLGDADARRLLPRPFAELSQVPPPAARPSALPQRYLLRVFVFGIHTHTAETNLKLLCQEFHLLRQDCLHSGQCQARAPTVVQSLNGPNDDGSNKSTS